MKRALIILSFLLLMPALPAQKTRFAPGEKSTYLIHYGLMSGGIARVQLVEDTLNGKKVWRSTLVGQTTGIADALYKVRDIYESYMDPVTLLPYKSVRDIQEGRYKKYNVVTFDHKSRKDSAILSSDLSGIHITQKNIFDIVSCFYTFRKNHLPNYKNFKEGDVLTVVTWFADEFYPIRLRYVGRDEVRTKAGKIKCLKFNPVTEVGRVFKTEEDMSVWFSEDDNFLPVKIRFDIFVGAVTCDLVSYEGLANPLNIK